MVKNGEKPCVQLKEIDNIIFFMKKPEISLTLWKVHKALL